MSRRKKTITSACAAIVMAVFAATAVVPPALANGLLGQPPGNFGIDLGRCNRDLLGLALDAAAGAALGTHVG